MKTDKKTRGGPTTVPKTRINHQRNVERKTKFKDLRNAALVEWRQLLAA